MATLDYGDKVSKEGSGRVGKFFILFFSLILQSY